MRYLGGKSRLAKKFAHLIDAELAKPEFGGRFVEPFVGGFNVLPTLKNAKLALCSDIHPGLINMYNALQDGWEPPTSVSEERYQDLKSRRGVDAESAFVSFACSYGGKEWGGFARGKNSRGEWRNWADESARRLATKLPTEAPTHFICQPFDKLPRLKPAVWYMDPPYRNTTKYKTGSFDHNVFDDFCRRLAFQGSAVFVSEFDAPFDVVWSIKRRGGLDKKDGSAHVDRLYRV